MNKQVSIVIVTYNSLKNTTQPCLESIYSIKTNVEFELIVVDNCSSDGTREYLLEQEKIHSNLKVILNENNLGFAGGNNIGIKECNNSLLTILLNNDTIVNDYWLDKFVEFFDKHPEVGIAGPVTNSIGNEQRIFVKAQDEEGVIREGLEWAEMCKGNYFYTNLIGFFCAAIKNELFETVGLLDEGFGIGMFEDDDYCYRALSGGYKLACIEDLFIYHKGSISFNKLGSQLNDLFYTNLNRFQTKHGVTWNTNHTVKNFLKQIENYNDASNAHNFNLVKKKISNKISLITNHIHLDPPHPQANMQLEQILNSDAWKIVKKYYEVRDKNELLKWGVKLVKAVKREGVKSLLARKTQSLSKKINPANRKMNEIKKDVKNKRVIVFPTPLDWNIPLFQRPQQLAKAYSKKSNTVVIYFTDLHQFDHFDTADKIHDNLWLVDSRYLEEISGILNKTQCETIISLSWTGNLRFVEKIKPKYLIYEYIDELSLFTGYSEKMVLEHNQLLREADVSVATATKLFDEIKGVAKNPILSTNAGDYEFFKETSKYSINERIKAKIQNYDFVIGYYGALASWFDFELVKEIARQKPNWVWVLVGWDYDSSLSASGIEELSNIICIEAQPYIELPSFLTAFDVATLPFKVNEITLSTSPVKIFEYMAAGKPIISSNLPECRKYDSIFLYENAEEFISLVNKIQELTETDEYWTTLRDEAYANTWDIKTDEILSALKINNSMIGKR